ncbi:hypothetical protein, partial [Acidianus sp. RZ1]|uniref:hypothetical protein n=1 Tax=Acidianus sp. RZ1 TaxID=1540082 RepID=UPI0020A28F2D
RYGGVIEYINIFFTKLKSWLGASIKYNLSTLNVSNNLKINERNKVFCINDDLIPRKDGYNATDNSFLRG